MTAEQLEELLGKVTQGEWAAYEAPNSHHETCMEVPSIGYDGELSKYDATLIALAPSLARRVIAAEKMDRNAVARIIDPLAWQQWDAVRCEHYGSYGLNGEPEGRQEDETCARWRHKEMISKSCTASLEKSDAIIALTAYCEASK